MSLFLTRVDGLLFDRQEAFQLIGGATPGEAGRIFAKVLKERNGLVESCASTRNPGEVAPKRQKRCAPGNRGPEQTGGHGIAQAVAAGDRACSRLMRVPEISPEDKCTQNKVEVVGHAVLRLLAAVTELKQCLQ